MKLTSFLSNIPEELWSVYSWWGCVHVLKMMTLIWFTGRIRHWRQVIHSEEDRVWMQGPHVILCPTGGGHPDVDRIRKVHRYDLYTVLPYLFITPLWLNTGPSHIIARLIIPFFGIASILYTVFYMDIISHCQLYKTALSIIIIAVPTYITVMSAMYYY